MQLEEEVSALQGINQQQLANITGLQQESSLLCECPLPATPQNRA
jgi:hypothetical protein